MKKIFNKKQFLTVLLILITASFGFSQNFGLDLLKNSDLTLSCPFSVTTGDIFKFTKANVGPEVRIGTRLYKTKDNSFSMGLCTTYNFNAYLFNREEISKFYTHSLMEGMWMCFKLPEDFYILGDLGIGLGITKVTATDIRGAAVDNYFNSLIIGTTVVVTHRFFDIGKCTVFWNGGLETRIYIEQNSCFQSFGVIAGLTVKAR